MVDPCCCVSISQKECGSGWGKSATELLCWGHLHCPALSEIATDYFILEPIGLGNSLRRTLSRDHPCDFKSHLIPG